ncbi:hypothetical protein BTA51_29095, partial [Hahella sp. CCB-MM4]|uniref:hypothetical protein n=1 Tax=Hahella sp. (strain CCB-MM4) TaxID=1926491 RepID=UPI000BD331E6
SGLQLALLRGADRTTALSDPEAFPDYDQSGTELLPRRVVDLELNLTGVKPNFSNLDSIYTPAFNTVDALDDNFPYSMFNSTG